MQNVSQRDVVKYLGGLLPTGALAVASALPAEAGQKPNNEIDEERAQMLIAAIKPCVVLLEVEDQYGNTGWGSGFFVSKDGIVITNRHVVEDVQKATCLVRNKDKYPAKVLKIDDLYDLAIVKVDIPGDAPTVRLGNSDDAKPGTLIAVTGYPQPGIMVWLGMALDSSTSRGALNGLRFGGDANSFIGDRALQIDAPVTGGNSGGPVFRLDTGEVIGVLSANIANAGNLTIAVPINPAKVLLSGSGVQVQPNAIKGNAPEAQVEPGEIRLLNTISSAKEVSALFGNTSFIADNSEVSRGVQQAKIDWEESVGQQPPLFTPIVENGNEMFLGSANGALTRWRPRDIGISEPSLTLVNTADDGQIFIYPPEVTEELVIAASGALDLEGRIRLKKDAVSVIGGLLGFGRGQEEKITIEGEGSIFGVNRRNGSINWRVESGFVATPVLHDGKVFFGGVGVRGCVEAVQGKEIFPTIRQKESGRQDWNYIGYAGKSGIFSIVVPMEGKREKNSPTISLFAKNKARVESHDPATGKILWKTEIGNVNDRRYPLATAMYVDEEKQILYAVAVKVLVAVDIRAKNVLWTYDQSKPLEKSKKQREKEASKTIAFTPGLVVHEGIIYVGSTDKKLYAINGQDGTELWNYTTRGDIGHPTYHDGQIIFGSGDGILHVVDARTGQLAWRIRTGSPVRSKPLVHAGMIYAPNQRGLLWSMRIPTA